MSRRLVRGGRIIPWRRVPSLPVGVRRAQGLLAWGVGSCENTTPGIEESSAGRLIDVEEGLRETFSVFGIPGIFVRGKGDGCNVSRGSVESFGSQT